MLRFGDCACLLAVFLHVSADLYMHNPRGSNNRLNEKSANRNNANRLFNSQNNNRGGYNVIDLDDADGFDQNNPYAEDIDTMYSPQAQLDNVQYNMIFQEGSLLRLTWTAQHGCGNAFNNCNFVIQFACDTSDTSDEDFDDLPYKGLGIRMNALNGGNTNTPGETDNVNNIEGTYDNNNDNERGRHESEEFYTMCRNRDRNNGLFLADQNLKGSAQKYTRQNPNGNRNGLECPEERDYYPWNYPSPFRDVAWLGNDVEYCKENIAPFSQNVSPKGACTNGDEDDVPTQDQISANSQEECESDDVSGTWVETSWGGTNDEAFAEALCQEQNWSQANHLGNVDGTAKGGQTDSYEWWIPSFDQLTTDWKCHNYNEDVESANEDEQSVDYVRGILRMRYNISTMDYDPYLTNASYNNDPANGVISPITQNPTVDIGAYMQGLRLAINTAQTGRTFQDRSHVFNIMKKPTGNGATAAATAAKAAQVAETNLLNVNVRGKRGNIVQTFPAVEYDFEPNDFYMEQGQCVHFQWGGSNTHNNGNPAGDGQAGDAGEGRGGSDRSNLMEMTKLRNSYPMPYDQYESFFDQVTCKRPIEDEALSAEDVQIVLATAGYFMSYNDADTNTDDNVDPLLNNVSGAFKQGVVCCTDENTTPGDYYFLSTRNNNFSNRAQKMKIRVVEPDTGEFQFFAPEPITEFGDE